MFDFIIRCVLTLFATAGVGAIASADMAAPGARKVRPTYRINPDMTLPDHVGIIYKQTVVYNATPSGFHPERIDTAEYVDIEKNTNVTIAVDDTQSSYYFILVPRRCTATFHSAKDLAASVLARQVEPSICHQFAPQEVVPFYCGNSQEVNYILYQNADYYEIMRTTVNKIDLVLIIIYALIIVSIIITLIRIIKLIYIRNINTSIVDKS
jgi:hypothetical protein